MNATDILNAGPSFEQRAYAWGAAAIGLEEKAAEEAVIGLGKLIAALSAGVDHALKQGLARAALHLRNQAVTRGAEGLCAPLLAYDGPIVQQDPGRQAMYDALLLRSIGEGICDDLADAIEVRAADDGVANYGQEIIATALLDVALAQVDPTDDFALVDDLISVQREVARTPRAVAERTIITEVRPGDTMQSLARRVYGSPEEWQRLISDYNLQPPYLTQSPRSGCLSPGVRLLRPGALGDSAGDQTLGVSFRFDARADQGGQEWDLVPAASGGIEMAYGLDALAVDCAVRLATPLGDLLDLPNYGYPEIPGLPASSANMMSAMLAAETLLEDERVADVVPSLDARTSRRDGRLVGNVLVVPRL